MALFLIFSPLQARDISSKVAFVQKKYLYHTGNKCSVEYAEHIVEAFDPIEDPHLRTILMALACVESGYNHKALTVNRKGRSVGLMQIHSGIFRYFFDPTEKAENILLNYEVGPMISVEVAAEHFANMGYSVRAYYLGPRGAKLRPKKASGYAVKVWKVLGQMPWIQRNRNGEPARCYWVYFKKAN